MDGWVPDPTSCQLGTGSLSVSPAISFSVQSGLRRCLLVNSRGGGSRSSYSSTNSEQRQTNSRLARGSIPTMPGSVKGRSGDPDPVPAFRGWSLFSLAWRDAAKFKGC
ncbi:hypothetical protein JDV02_006582 [Purpureocillium takamizusanense]|uniref:Uncharacterized protein n=1 Tax=Purpureocillium takamizusanense TaxID=2060973 RepID=A0A9Q8QJQ1_9HYPO|nr:uncharacterized protein JDV02_006582 [Purpureocillium takamizusanense]UNI20502.1 hypothetical protein JDV02_006582 [Purpureocillium takamizusanense]